MSADSEPLLLIALTGSPGEGRTSQLAALAVDAKRGGQRVAGFLAVAGRRRDGVAQGAASYDLQMLGESEPRPWAVRDEMCDPPYRFDVATRAHLVAWATHLREQPRIDLLVLDEFGRFEAAGAGLLPLWPALGAAAPRIVVVAVRAGYLTQIEERLGRTFDLSLAAGHPATPERLRQACADFGEWTKVGLWGGAAGAIEMTFGSMLHALKVPLRGAALCSTQAAMLTFASAKLIPPGRVAWVAFIAAGLKAFSPGGGRVRPMVAITVQGALFSAVVQLFGWHLAAVTLGGALIGAWAALQGFLLQYLLLGDELVVAYSKVVAWLAANWQVQAPSISVLLAVWAAGHALAAGGAAVAAWRLRAPPRVLRAVLEGEAAGPAMPTQLGASPPPVPWMRRVAREFARWHFWIPLVAVAAVLLASGRPWESVAWLAARFVAVGAVVFALLSLFQPAGVARALRRLGWWGPAAAFDQAVSRRTRR